MVLKLGIWQHLLEKLTMLCIVVH